MQRKTFDFCYRTGCFFKHEGWSRVSIYRMFVILWKNSDNMKIITWNCNMAFRKKASFILTHKPDILIIVECEHPEKLVYKVDTPKPTDSLWFGKNQHKGLAIFSYGDYRFKVLENHNEEFKTIIPIQVTGGSFDFNLFLIWAYNRDDKDGK